MDSPEFVNTTLRREITQNYLADSSESVLSSPPLSVSSSEGSLNGFNLPSKENSPNLFKVIVL